MDNNDDRGFESFRALFLLILFMGMLAASAITYLACTP